MSFAQNAAFTFYCSLPTIGAGVYSFCIRLFNQDTIDLYNRVPVGTHVVVLRPFLIELPLQIIIERNEIGNARYRFAVEERRRCERIEFRIGL